MNGDDRRVEKRTRSRAWALRVHMWMVGANQPAAYTLARGHEMHFPRLLNIIGPINLYSSTLHYRYFLHVCSQLRIMQTADHIETTEASVLGVLLCV